MSDRFLLQFKDIKADGRLSLPFGSFIERSTFKDSHGSIINILRIFNGILTFTVLLERGMDLGEILLGQEKISWNRSEVYLLHPDNVDLHANNNAGWENGFYAAVAAIGPEIFGTPDEIRTVHGTGSYSKTDMKTVYVSWDKEQICIEGTVPIKGYQENTIYRKSIKIISKYNSYMLVRKDSTKNLTGDLQPLDDGFHIQLAGEFVSKGGKYVLPVAKDKMLLRDSAPKEENPLEIYEFSRKLDPIRCYQYIPEPVNGLERIEELTAYSEFYEDCGKITAEMIVNTEKNAAAYVIRPLKSFSRSLIAKRAVKEPMYALEPCRTRPNSLAQKTIDGETTYLEPYGQEVSWIMLGVTRSPSLILLMETLIDKAR